MDKAKSGVLRQHIKEKENIKNYRVKFYLI